MSNRRDLPVRRSEHPSQPPIDVQATMVDTERPHEPLLRKLRRILHGRYMLATLLGLLGAAGGTYAGWKSQRPLYQAQGLIRVAASVPTPKDPDARNVLPMVKGYMAFQVQLLTSPTLTREAMMEEAWEETGEGISPETIQSFEMRRGVHHDPDTLHIVVTFSDPDPRVALAGVRSILEAYEARAEVENSKSKELRYATDRTELLAAQMKSESEELLRLLRDFGTIDVLEMEHRAAYTSLREAEKELGKLLALLGTDADNGDEEPSHKEMTLQQIKLKSPALAQATRDLANLEREEKTQAAVLGDKNQVLIDLRQRIDDLRTWIQEYVDTWNQELAEVPPEAGPDREDIRREVEVARQEIDRLRAKWFHLSSLLTQIHELQANGEALKRQHEEMRSAKEEIQARLEVSGRISISERGELPVYPARDRRIPFAALGGLFGAGLGVLLVVLLALRDRRFRDSGDIGTTLSRVKLLGLLPEIPDDLGNPQSAEVAAHCVHQIRTLLQIHPPAGRGAHFCITGPGVGSGKTTLSLALAVSYAHAGCRTLLVDADLSGRGLTRRVGRVLYEHAYREARLEDARAGSDVAQASAMEPLLIQPRRGPRPTVDGLAELLHTGIANHGLSGARSCGLVDQVFALDALLFHGRGRAALIETLSQSTASDPVSGPADVGALAPSPVKELTAEHPEVNGAPLQSYLYPSGLDRLQFMPLRGLKRGHLLSARSVEQLLDRASREFDVVLVDTGPVLGAVETALVASAVDGTVVVVCPSDQRPDAERAVERLEDVGASIRGLVFNRAAIRHVLKTSHSRSSVDFEGEDA